MAYINDIQRIDNLTIADIIRVSYQYVPIIKQRKLLLFNLLYTHQMYSLLQLSVSIRLRTTCIFDSKLEATCSSWPKLGQVDPSWSVLPTCLAGVHGELHGCSRSRVSGAGHPPSIHVD